MVEATEPTAAQGGDAVEEAPFEALVGELEQIVEGLERGEMSLEESLAAFERGMGLSRQAGQRLDAAEQRIEVLVGEGGETAPLEAG